MTHRTLVPVPTRLDFDALVPTFSRAMSALEDATTTQLDEHGTDAALRELVRLRVSQINGCAYCVNMHSAGARAAGASTQLVDAVAIWPESGLFTSAERSALALGEAIANVAGAGVDAAVVEAAGAEHGQEGTAALIAACVSVSAWNTIGASTHCWTVEPRTDR